MFASKIGLEISHLFFILGLNHLGPIFSEGGHSESANIAKCTWNGPIEIFSMSCKFCFLR